MGKISVDVPLAEITLRKYEKPQGELRRDLVRKLCLSLGLLQPGDSRDVVVDVFHAMLDADGELSSTDVEERVVRKRQEAPSNIRRQLLRLRDMFIVEKIKNNYRIREHTTITAIFEENIERYYLASIIARVKEHCAEIDKAFFGK